MQFVCGSISVFQSLNQLADNYGIFCKHHVIDGRFNLVLYSLKLNKNKQSPWPESASELYRPRARRLLSVQIYDVEMTAAISCTVASSYADCATATLIYYP
jgi:hypothetical protein